MAKSTAPIRNAANEATNSGNEHYNKGGNAHEQLDEEIHPLKLTKEQVADLVTFMKEGLACDSYPYHKAPELPK